MESDPPARSDGSSRSPSTAARDLGHELDHGADANPGARNYRPTVALNANAAVTTSAQESPQVVTASAWAGSCAAALR